MNRFAESRETGAYSQPLMSLRTQFPERAKKILAQDPSDSRLTPTSIKHVLNEPWKMISTSQIRRWRNETIIVGPKGYALFARDIDDVFHMLDQHRPIVRSASTPEKPVVGHDGNHPASLGDGPDLSVIEITPMRTDAIDSGVRDDERLTGIMDIDRIPETFRSNMSQIDEYALRIKLFDKLTSLWRQTFIPAKKVCRR